MPIDEDLNNVSVQGVALDSRPFLVQSRQGHHLPQYGREDYPSLSQPFAVTPPSPETRGGKGERLDTRKHRVEQDFDLQVCVACVSGVMISFFTLAGLAEGPH